LVSLEAQRFSVKGAVASAVSLQSARLWSAFLVEKLNGSLLPAAAIGGHI
jgi:hypothetical protein